METNNAKSTGIAYSVINDQVYAYQVGNGKTIQMMPINYAQKIPLALYNMVPPPLNKSQITKTVHISKNNKNQNVYHLKCTIKTTSSTEVRNYKFIPEPDGRYTVIVETNDQPPKSKGILVYIPVQLPNKTIGYTPITTSRSPATDVVNFTNGTSIVYSGEVDIYTAAHFSSQEQDLNFHNTTASTGKPQYSTLQSNQNLYMERQKPVLVTTFDPQRKKTTSEQQITDITDLQLLKTKIASYQYLDIISDIRSKHQPYISIDYINQLDNKLRNQKQLAPTELQNIKKHYQFWQKITDQPLLNNGKYINPKQVDDGKDINSNLGANLSPIAYGKQITNYATKSNCGEENLNIDQCFDAKILTFSSPECSKSMNGFEVYSHQLHMHAAEPEQILSKTESNQTNFIIDFNRCTEQYVFQSYGTNNIIDIYTNPSATPSTAPTNPNHPVLQVTDPLHFNNNINVDLRSEYNNVLNIHQLKIYLSDSHDPTNARTINLSSKKLPIAGLTVYADGTAVYLERELYRICPGKRLLTSLKTQFPVFRDATLDDEIMIQFSDETNFPIICLGTYGKEYKRVNIHQDLSAIAPQLMQLLLPYRLKTLAYATQSMLPGAGKPEEGLFFQDEDEEHKCSMADYLDPKRLVSTNSNVHNQKLQTNLRFSTCKASGIRLNSIQQHMWKVSLKEDDYLNNMQKLLLLTLKGHAAIMHAYTPSKTLREQQEIYQKLRAQYALIQQTMDQEQQIIQSSANSLKSNSQQILQDLTTNYDVLQQQFTTLIQFGNQTIQTSTYDLNNVTRICQFAQDSLELASNIQLSKLYQQNIQSLTNNQQLANDRLYRYCQTNGFAIPKKLKAPNSKLATALQEFQQQQQCIIQNTMLVKQQLQIGLAQLTLPNSPVANAVAKIYTYLLNTQLMIQNLQQSIAAAAKQTPLEQMSIQQIFQQYSQKLQEDPLYQHSIFANTQEAINCLGKTAINDINNYTLSKYSTYIKELQLNKIVCQHNKELADQQSIEEQLEAKKSLTQLKHISIPTSVTKFTDLYQRDVSLKTLDTAKEKQPISSNQQNFDLTEPEQQEIQHLTQEIMNDLQIDPIHGNTKPTANQIENILKEEFIQEKHFKTSLEQLKPYHMEGENYSNFTSTRTPLTANSLQYQINQNLLHKKLTQLQVLFQCLSTAKLTLKNLKEQEQLKQLKSTIFEQFKISLEMQQHAKQGIQEEQQQYELSLLSTITLITTFDLRIQEIINKLSTSSPSRPSQLSQMLAQQFHKLRQLPSNTLNSPASTLHKNPLLQSTSNHSQSSQL